MNHENIQLSLALADFYSSDTVKGDGATLDERFESFHARNPHVYRALTSLARKMKAQGHSRVSMKGLFEFLRMSKALHTTGSAFKLNNNHTSFYARMICEREPDIAELFERRGKAAA